MEFEYDRVVDAPAEVVWAALTEPRAMEPHLPGGASVASVGHDRIRVSMKVSMGIMRPTVNIDVQLSDVRPNESATFEFAGKAMGAGVKGTAGLSLSGGGSAGAGPNSTTRVGMTGSVQTSGLLKKVSDSKVDAAVTGFLDRYFTDVERAARRA